MGGGRNSPPPMWNRVKSDFTFFKEKVGINEKYHE